MWGSVRQCEGSKGNGQCKGQIQGFWLRQNDGLGQVQIPRFFASLRMTLRVWQVQRQPQRQPQLQKQRQLQKQLLRFFAALRMTNKCEGNGNY